MPDEADRIDTATDTAARQAIGEELRRARDTIGWTRAEMAERLPFDIHVQTLAAYERGIIQVPVSKMILMCGAMGVSAPDLLAWAMQRAGIDLATTGLQVDLHAVVNDKKADLLPLRRWARQCLQDDPGAGIARLDWPAVQAMARLFGAERDEFIQTLVLFTPRPVPKRR